MPEIFSQDGLLVLIRLIVAHLVADFLLQPNQWIVDRAQRKAKSPFLYLHGLIVGLLAYLFLADWAHLWLPLFIMITHIGIDIWKSYQKDNALYFVLDQFFHFIIIIVGWAFYLGEPQALPFAVEAFFSQFRIWVLAMAYLFIVWPTGFFVAKATAHWRQEIDEIDNRELAGLSYAGKWIGRIERILILTFVMFNHYEAIGFLIAAKSIFRVNGIKEKHDRKEVEYILIGTLLSFAIAILAGLLVRVMIQ